MIDLSHLATNLELRDDCVWFSRETSPVSFPEDGNQVNFELEDRSFWFRHRNDCILEVVRSFPPGGPIFDVGGGNGYVAQALAGAGFETVVLEPGIEGIRNARRRGLRPLVCASLEDAGFRRRSLPAVGLFDVLEHIRDDVRFLARMESLLVSNGTLYLTVPDYRLLWSWEDDVAGHYRRYTLRSLKGRLKEAGLDVLFGTYFFSFLPLPILLTRTLPDALGFQPADARQRYRKEHELRGGMTARAVRALCAAEHRWIAARRMVPLGGSCLIAARARGC
ncbi:MAG: class I SAM-dependent methyltransferase [Capsulimonadaceae bacterium]